jgi:hypothetical protein
VGEGRRGEAAPRTGPKNGPPVSARGNGSAGRTIAQADRGDDVALTVFLGVGKKSSNQDSANSRLRC